MLRSRPRSSIHRLGDKKVLRYLRRRLRNQEQLRVGAVTLHPMLLPYSAGFTPRPIAFCFNAAVAAVFESAISKVLPMLHAVAGDTECFPVGNLKAEVRKRGERLDVMRVKIATGRSTPNTAKPVALFDGAGPGPQTIGLAPALVEEGNTTLPCIRPWSSLGFASAGAGAKPSRTISIGENRAAGFARSLFWRKMRAPASRSAKSRPLRLTSMHLVRGAATLTDKGNASKLPIRPRIGGWFNHSTSPTA